MHSSLMQCSALNIGHMNSVRSLSVYTWPGYQGQDPHFQTSVSCKEKAVICKNEVDSETTLQ